MEEQKKVELLPERQAVLSVVIAVMCVVALGTFIIPMFDKELAISMNHMMISFLPGSFEPLKFVSDDLDISQKGQLVFRNLPLLPLVIFYPVSYLIVLATAKKRL